MARQAAMWDSKQEGFALTSPVGRYGGSRPDAPVQPVLFESRADTEIMRERAIEAQAQAAGRRGGLTAYNEVREAHGLPRVRSAVEQEAARESVPAAAPIETPKASSDVELIEGYHTGWSAPAFIVRLPRDLGGDFRDLAAMAKRLGGYYQKAGPRFPWGFYLRSKVDAQAFIREAMNGAGRQPEDAAPVAAAAPLVSKYRPARDGAPRPQLEKLRTLASKLRERAEAEEQRPRVTNTYRRAGQAAHVQARAREDQRRADSLERLATAIEQGQAPALANLASMTQLDALDLVLRRAHWEHNQAHGHRHDEGDINNPANLEHIRFPWPRTTGSNLASTLKDLKSQSDDIKALYRRAKQAGEDYVTIDDAKVLAALRKPLLRLPSSNTLKLQLLELERLLSLGLTNREQLQEAARQYLTCCRGQARRESPLAAAVRGLIGHAWPGYFPTPPPAADRLIELAAIPDGARVLEPSAGKGDLADAVRRAVATAEVDVIEPVEALRSVLGLKGYELVGRDFLKDTPARRYARIVMNPPFERGADAQHVRHAFALLEPGGRLAAIVSEGLFFRQDAEEFRQWLTSVGGRSEKLPTGSFRTSDRPTDVAAHIVVIDKSPAERAAPDLNPYWLAFARSQGHPPDARSKLRNGDFMAWMGARWTEWRRLNKRSEDSPLSAADHTAFGAWLEAQVKSQPAAESRTKEPPMSESSNRSKGRARATAQTGEAAAKPARVTAVERERQKQEQQRQKAAARQAAENERLSKNLEAAQKKRDAEAQQQQQRREAAAQKQASAAQKQKEGVERRKAQQKAASERFAKKPPLVRAEVIDPLTGERIAPDLPGATVTGRLVIPVPTQIGRLSVPVAPEDVDPRTQSFRLLDGRAVHYHQQAEDNAGRIAANATAMQRWAGGERFASVAAAVAEYMTRNGLYEHIEVVADLDPVNEWMGRVEVRAGRKAIKALRDTPAGRRIAEAWAQGPRAGARVALGYIFGQGKARKWDAIPWRMVDDLERLLRRAAGKEAQRLGRTWDLSSSWRPATLRRGELPDGAQFADLSDADRAMVTQHHHAEVFREAAATTLDLLKRHAKCLTPELRRLVKARAATFSRWSKNPALAPQRLCDPLARYGDRVCDYPAITADLEQLAHVCQTNTYDPALAQRYVAEEAYQPPDGYQPDDNFVF